MLTKEQAAFLLDVLNTPGMSVPTADAPRLQLVLDTRKALEQITSAIGHGE